MTTDAAYQMAEMRDALRKKFDGTRPYYKLRTDSRSNEWVYRCPCCDDPVKDNPLYVNAHVRMHSDDEVAAWWVQEAFS